MLMDVAKAFEPTVAFHCWTERYKKFVGYLRDPGAWLWATNPRGLDEAIGYATNARASAATNKFWPGVPCWLCRRNMAIEMFFWCPTCMPEALWTRPPNLKETTKGWEGFEEHQAIVLRITTQDLDADGNLKRGAG